MPDEIEGEIIETALTVQEPIRLSLAATPVAMIELATAMATALKDIVERQKLYSVISGKKFPQVEAWMTIARMDNVVAREAEHPIRHDDGSYEAFVELVRLSDGLVIGRASALCGTVDDKPWNGRGEPQRRSMAVTRATSRAFRQQYSWIMALAGYEPTPAEEMRGDESRDDGRADVVDGGLIGTAAKGAAKTTDYLVRQSPDEGSFLGFRLMDGSSKSGQIIEAVGPIADALALIEDDVIGHRVQIWGHFRTVELKGKNASYPAFRIEKIITPNYTLPADEAPSLPLFSPEEEAQLDAVLVP